MIESEDSVQYLNTDGLLTDNYTPSLSVQAQKDIFWRMRLGRLLDNKMKSLTEEGKVNKFPGVAGQEAAQVASALALDEHDKLYPTYRDSLAMHTKGVPLHRLLLYWRGLNEGVSYKDHTIHPFTVPIASHLPQAVGAGIASQYTGENGRAIAYFGDGATSSPAFHSGLNYAGVFEAPVIFFCNNNQYAITTPFEKQTAAENIAVKASAYGIDSIQIDGMDPFAVYDSVQKALDSASNGTPVLIEAIQYRFRGHTVDRKGARYRDEEEMEMWESMCPIKRLGQHLMHLGEIDTIDAFDDEIQSEIDTAWREAENTETVDFELFMKNIYQDSVDSHSLYTTEVISNE